MHAPFATSGRRVVLAREAYRRSASQRPAQAPFEPVPRQVPVPALADRRPVPLASLSPPLMLTWTAPFGATVPFKLTAASP